MTRLDFRVELARRGSLRAAATSEIFIIEAAGCSVTVWTGDFESGEQLLALARALRPRKPTPETHAFSPLEWLRNNPGSGRDDLLAATEAAVEAGFEILGDFISLEVLR